MNIATQVILPLILAFMMFSMGLDLLLEDFKRVGKYPKAFFSGLLLQFVSLPLLAFVIAKVSIDLGMDPSFAIGLIIIAACPGGVTSNMMTHMARGDTALSISLTAVTSLASVLTLPFIVHLGLNFFSKFSGPVDFPIGKTIFGIFMITTVPVLLGMLVRSKKEKWAKQWEPLFRKSAALLFVLVIVAAVAKDFNLAVEGFASLGPAVLLLNGATMLVALAVAKMASLNGRQASAIAYECGFQNGTLAIFIALSLLKSEKMMLPGAIYGLTMFATGGLYFWWLQRKSEASRI